MTTSPHAKSTPISDPSSEPSQTDAPRWARPVMALFLVPTALLIVAVAVISMLSTNPVRLVAIPLQASFPLVGLVILRSRPRNTVGWCFVVSGLLLAINGIGDAGVALSVERRWDGPLSHVFGWCNAFAWFPGLFTLITVALLHFPDGKPVSPRWRWLSVVAIALMTVFAVCFSIVIWQVPVTEFSSSASPSAPGWRGVLLTVGIACVPLMLPVVLGTVASLVVRWRRSNPVERLQIRWVAAAGTAAVLVEVLLDLAGTIGHVGDVVQTLAESISFALIAVATGVAITRHRLYEIDRIVSRTVSYLLISALLVGVYAGVVTGAGLFIPDRYGSVGVAVATLAAVALFVPLRTRIQHAVDRRFDRARYDGDQLVSSFSVALRADLSPTGLHEELLRAVQQAVAPSAATVWVVPAEARPSAVSPAIRADRENATVMTLRHISG